MTDKVSRVVTSGLPGMVRHGRVLLPKSADWRQDLVSETGFFPYGEHDDQVDALAFAAWYCGELPKFSPKKVKKVPTLQEEIDAQVDKESRNRGYNKRDNWSMIGRR